MSALIFKGPLYEKVWGSSYFKDKLHISDNPLIGEEWSLSGYNNKSSVCINGIYKNKSLDDLFLNYPEIFNNINHDKEFPILIKLIATESPLSVQVHPNDDYARKYENSYGKTEGWLILSDNVDQKIVLGHNAESIDELNNLIDNHKFNELLNEVNVKKGDFYPIPSGTIHALGANIVLIEIQQSSDVTYRVYDYDRLGLDGKLRELHIDKAKDVISLDKYNNDIINIFDNNKTNMLWNNKYFSVYYENINNEYICNAESTYIIGTVASGDIYLDNNLLNIGDSFIVPYKDKEIIKGNGLVVFTKPNM